MINWGDVPTWIAGVVAAGTPIVAHVAYRRGRQRARDQERRSQARQVHIACFPIGETTMLHPPPMNIQPFQIKVWNASPAPITDVSIMFSTPLGVPSFDDAYQADGVPRERFIESGEAVEMRVTAAMFRLDYRLDDLYARVAFTDAEGQRWIRLRNGEIFERPQDIPYKMYNGWAAGERSSKKATPRARIAKLLRCVKERVFPSGGGGKDRRNFASDRRLGETPDFRPSD